MICHECNAVYSIFERVKYCLKLWVNFMCFLFFVGNSIEAICQNDKHSIFTILVITEAKLPPIRFVIYFFYFFQWTDEG